MESALITIFIMNACQESNGFSLIEVMVALVLSLILLAGFVQVFLSQRQQYQVQSAMAAIQENGRAAITLLSNAIHEAGYLGCLSLSENTVIQSSEAIKKTLVNKQDALVVQHMSSQTNALTEDMKQNNRLLLGLYPRYKKGEQLIISDCVHSELFQIEKVSISKRFNQQWITSTKALKNRYYQFADLGSFMRHTFYIKKTTRRDLAGRPIHAMYVRGVNKRAHELIEGVDSMKLQISNTQPQQVHIDLQMNAPAANNPQHFSTSISTRTHAA